METMRWGKILATTLGGAAILGNLAKPGPDYDIGGAVYKTENEAEFKLPPGSYASDCNRIGYYTGEEIIITPNNPPNFGDEAKLVSCPSR